MGCVTMFAIASMGGAVAGGIRPAGGAWAGGAADVAPGMDIGELGTAGGGGPMELAAGAGTGLGAASSFLGAAGAVAAG